LDQAIQIVVNKEIPRCGEQGVGDAGHIADRVIGIVKTLKGWRERINAGAAVLQAEINFLPRDQLVEIVEGARDAIKVANLILLPASMIKDKGVRLCLFDIAFFYLASVSR